jgi:hypothetical protein
MGWLTTRQHFITLDMQADFSAEKVTNKGAFLVKAFFESFYETFPSVD